MSKAKIRGKIPIGEATVYGIGNRMYIRAKNSKILMMARAPPKRRRRKEQAGPIKQLSPAPLPKNSAGFGKCWIGDDLYRVSDDTIIPRVVLDAMKEKRGRR